MKTYTRLKFGAQTTPKSFPFADTGSFKARDLQSRMSVTMIKIPDLLQETWEIKVQCLLKNATLTNIGTSNNFFSIDKMEIGQSNSSSLHTLS